MIYIGHRHRSLGDPVYWVRERWTRPAWPWLHYVLPMVAEVCQQKGCSVGLHWAVVWPKVVSDSLGTPQRGVRDPTPLTDRTDGRRTVTVVHLPECMCPALPTKRQ